MDARRVRPLEISGFWACCCGLVACALVLAGLLFAVPVAGARPAYTHCGEITLGRDTLEVTIPEGHASCAEARRIMHKLYTGNDRGHGYGEHHNPSRDLAETYWLIDGWKCQVGAGGGGCTSGPRNEISGNFVPEEE
jgi:hypothetical protein